MNAETFSTSDLHRLQQQLFAWRRNQTGPARLPERLWHAATELARSRGPSTVARTLRLDYYKLRARLTSTPADGEATPTFVEVKVPATARGAARESVVELDDGTGARMTLRVRGDAATLVALAESFWRRPR